MVLIFAEKFKDHLKKDITECLKVAAGDSTPYKMNEKFFGTVYL